LKIAFLLGAGASNQFGIPTTEELAHEFLEIVDDHRLNLVLDENESNDIEALIKVIQQIKDLQTNTGLTFLNLSDSDWNTIGSVSDEYEGIEQKVFNFIREKCSSPDYSKAIKFYKPILDLQKRTGLNIFTTNYDMIIEEVCREQKISYNDGFRQEKHGYNIIFDPHNFGGFDIQLFKLHGSINWWSDDQRQKIFSLDPTLYGFEGYKNLMIYPAEKDDFFNFPFNILQYMFNLILNETDELIVIGHKFGDKNILAPISAALERPNFELTIINPSATEIKNKIFKDHDKVNVIDKTLEEWVTEGGVTQLENKFPKLDMSKIKDNITTVPAIQEEPIKQADIPLRSVPVAKHIPEAKGILFNLLDSMKDRQQCPKCGTEFSVQRIYQIFNCPHCNIQLERQKG